MPDHRTGIETGENHMIELITLIVIAIIIAIVIAINITLSIFLILTIYKELNPNKMTPIDEYAAANNLNPDEVIEKILDRQYKGKLIKGKWHIYAPNKDNSNKEKSDSS